MGELTVVMSLPSETSRRDQLAEDLARGGFLLRTGRPPDDGQMSWFETGLVLTRPGILTRCADVLAAGLPEGIDRVAARGEGAVALATAVSLRSGVDLMLGADGNDGPVFAGDAFPGIRVAVIEDAVLTGKHATESIDALREIGADVVAVVGLIDRERDGRFVIEEHGVPTFFGFREHELTHP